MLLNSKLNYFNGDIRHEICFCATLLKDKLDSYDMEASVRYFKSKPDSS